MAPAVSDSLEHILLRCPHLESARREALSSAAELIPSDPPPGKAPPPGTLPARVRHYLRRFLLLLKSPPTDSPPEHLTALWLGRPQQSTLDWLDNVTPRSDRGFSIGCRRRLRLHVIGIFSRLIQSARSMWVLRCREANLAYTPSQFSGMTAFHSNITEVQKNIGDFFPVGRSPTGWSNSTAPEMNLSLSFTPSASSTGDVEPEVLVVESDDDDDSGPPTKRLRRNPTRLARTSIGACNIGNSCFFSNASSRGRIPAHLLRRLPPYHGPTLP